MQGLDTHSKADIMMLTKQCLARADSHALDQSETLLDTTLDGEGVGGQVAQLQESLRRLQQEADDLAAANAELQGELAKVAARNEELEHDLHEASEQRSKFEKLYTDLLEETIKTSSRQSTKVTSEQADLELRLADAEAQLTAARSQVRSLSYTL
jgi:chromosome segregation ATPase